MLPFLNVKVLVAKKNLASILTDKILETLHEEFVVVS